MGKITAQLRLYTLQKIAPVEPLLLHRHPRPIPPNPAGRMLLPHRPPRPIPSPDTAESCCTDGASAAPPSPDTAESCCADGTTAMIDDSGATRAPVPSASVPSIDAAESSCMDDVKNIPESFNCFMLSAAHMCGFASAYFSRTETNLSFKVG